jgi:hypothetical protein
LLVLVCVLACAFGLATASSTSRASSASRASRATDSAARLQAVRLLAPRIATFQRTTWQWQRLMGVRLTETEGRNLAELSVRDIHGAVRLWQRRAEAARARAQHPPHLQAWLCIHHYEGRWNDPAPPYYGGLQMDLSFQRHYGRRLLQAKGTADHWLPIEQIWVAERAHASGRGFSPWPNTARACGLI